MLLAAFLLAVQATPEGVAERDARELAEALTGTWNNAEAAYFAAETGGYDVIEERLVVEADGDRLTVRLGGPDGLGPAEAWQVRGDIYGLVLAGTSRRTGRSCTVSVVREGEVFSASRPEEAAPCGLAGARGFVAAPGTLSLDWGEGGPVAFHRADPYVCWVSRKKDEGGEDAWTWTPDLALREGEYVQLPDDPAASRPVGLKLRHVRWPYGRNRDSLVLYVHEAEDAPAVSYAWTEPDAARIAINLRWVQASCTRDEG